MSDDRKRSPWITDRKPDFPGVYERQYAEERNLFCYWNGALWFWNGETPEEAIDSIKHGQSYRQNLPWRGLAEKP